jgi:hypothetical protein
MSFDIILVPIHLGYKVRYVFITDVGHIVDGAEEDGG